MIRLFSLLIGALMLVLVLADSVSPQQPYRKIMLFGGRLHDVYLGCLNCDQSALDSIFNEYGSYGRCPGPFSDNLYCHGPFKEFGGTGPFHDHSACASSPSDPPVIVDNEGNYEITQNAPPCGRG